MEQGDLFQDLSKPKTKAKTFTPDTPLAFRLRPQSLEELAGQENVFKRFAFLKEGRTLPSLILWGPPGSGKTTLAHLLAKGHPQRKYGFYTFNAVLGGVGELRKTIATILDNKKLLGENGILFIDEIHRFNKAQQDALLPYVEAGDFVLIGATTENPRSSVNQALLSRVQVIPLQRLKPEHLLTILQRARKVLERKLNDKLLELIADYADGDARKALNILDALVKTYGDHEISLEKAKKLILENARRYDKGQDRHYDVISAFIKSMRGSDPNAALLWLAVMLDGGEDPVFIARRLVIFASEDVGNADPQALSLAVAALTAVQNIGMPEARINLAQVTTYLASTHKSNASYMGINEALKFVEEHPTVEVPNHLKNYPPPGTPPYLYPHSYPEHYVKQQYAGNGPPQFYRPTEQGTEKKLKERLTHIKNLCP